MRWYEASILSVTYKISAIIHTFMYLQVYRMYESRIPFGTSSAQLTTEETQHPTPNSSQPNNPQPLSQYYY